MKLNIILITTVISGFLLVFLFFFNKKESVTDLDAAYLEQPIEQTMSEREWREPGFEKTSTETNFIPDSPLQFSSNGFLYVVDREEVKVNKITPQAQLMSQFGAGEGRGPGEFTAMTDLFFDPETEFLWLRDPANNRITIFNPNDSDDWTILELPEMASRVIPVGDDEYWLASFTSDVQFTRYSISGDIEGRTDNLVNDPSLWSVVLQNVVDISATGEIVQVHHHTNTLAGYSREGVLQFFRKPIAPTSLPTIIPYYANNDANRVNSVDPLTSVQVSRVVQIVGNTFHVYANQRDEQQDVFPPEFLPGYVDVYDLEEGDYLYSYRLPETFTNFGFAVSETHIAGINSETGELEIWRVMRGW